MRFFGVPAHGLLLVAVLAVLVGLLTRFGQDNVVFVRRLGLRKTATSFFLAAFVWLPFAVAVSPWVVGAWAFDTATDRVARDVLARSSEVQATTVEIQTTEPLTVTGTVTMSAPEVEYRERARAWNEPARWLLGPIEHQVDVVVREQEFAVDVPVLVPGSKSVSRFSSPQESDRSRMIRTLGLGLLELMSLQFLAVVALLVLRSLGYAWARTVCGRHPGAFTFTLLGEGNLGGGPTVSCVPTHVLQLESGHGWYFRQSLPGVPQTVSYPQPTASVVARIRAGTFAMNEVRLNTPLEYRLSPDGGKWLVVVSLQEGQEILLRHDRLVGFSEEVQLKTRLCLKAPWMAVGGLLLSTAAGPGTVVVLAKGAPTRPSVGAKNSLVTASATEALDVRGFGSIKDLWFSPLVVDAGGSPSAVVDPLSLDGQPTATGLWSTLKSVYSLG